VTATNAVEDVVEEIVDAAPGGRGGLGLAAAALLVGAGIGSGITYLLTKRQLETKYSQLADEEIADMREHYRAKGVALEATQGKKDLSELVREKGYVPFSRRSRSWSPRTRGLGSLLTIRRWRSTTSRARTA
jgi:hypothetical protein